MKGQDSAALKGDTMIRIIRKSSLAAPIIVLLALLILIGPLPRQEAEADGGLTIVLAGIAAGAVGAAIQGSIYYISHRVFGGDWNCADQYTNITLGFAEGVTFLWAALYAPAAFSAGILEITGELGTFETAHQIIADWLGDKLEAHFDFTCTPEEFEYAAIRSTLLAATPSLTLLLSPLVDAMTAAEGEEPDAPTFGPLFADFTNNTIDTSGMSITTYGMVHNTV